MHKQDLQRCALWLIALALLLGGSHAPLAAQTPDNAPVMEINLAWEGNNRQTWWTEARVILRNENADWQGDVVVTDKHNEVTYRLPVELPAHSYKQYRIPLFVKDGNTLAIALQSDDGLQQEQRVVLHALFDNNRIVVMADTRGPVITGPLAAQDNRVWLDTLDDLPETSMAWDTVDVLLLNGISTADLTDAQQEALLAWVGAGGHLIVGGGPSLPQTLDNLSEPLHIATLGDVHILGQLHLDNDVLSNVAAATLIPGGIAVPLATASGNTVAVRGVVGKGRVDIVGWDMAQPGGEAWLIHLWDKDPIPAIISPLTNAAASTGAPTSYEMLRIPMSTIPKLWVWLLLFPVYLFVMGPGTLILVRRLHKPVLAWVLLPAWIVLAIVILALGLSSAFSRTFPLIRESAIVTVPGENLPARVVQGTAIYAPRIRALKWTTGGAPRPMHGSYLFESWYNDGTPFAMDARYFDGGSAMQASNPLGVITWGSEGLFDAPNLAADLTIASHDGQLFIEGTVTGEAALRDVTLLIDDAQYAITLTNTASANTPVALSRPVTSTYTTRSGYQGGICGSRDYYNPYGAMVTSVVSNKVLARDTACYVTGLIDTVPFSTTGAGGTRVTESCLIYTVPCPAQPTGRLVAPLEIDPTRVENGWTEPELNITYGYAPNTTLYFNLPAYLQIAQIETLTVELQNAPEAGITSAVTDVEKISVWNWETETWMDYAPTAKPLILAGVDAAQAFDADEGVRLRLKPVGEGLTVRLSVTVEGRR